MKQFEILLGPLAKLPVWHLWDGDVERLINTAEIYIDTNLKSSDDFPVGRKINLCFWMLNRLRNDDAASYFSKFISFEKSGDSTPSGFGDINFAQAIYAWGRRLSVSERNAIFRTALSGRGFFRRYQAMIVAWAESCPDEMAETLFSWVDISSEEGVFVRDYDLLWFELLIQEFKKRVSSREGRIQILAEAADSLLHKALRTEKNDLKYLYSELFHEVLIQLLKDAARGCDTDDAPDVGREKTKAWEKWLGLKLRREGYERVAEIYQTASVYRCYPITRYNVYYLMAVQFWIESKVEKEWRTLEESCDRFENRAFYNFLERMCCLVPPGRIEVWDRILARGRYGSMAYFCQWLAPEYRDVLSRYYDIPEITDEAACAFNAYLSKAPEPVLQDLWRRKDDLPLWQSCAIDRWLHAPKEIKPKPVLWSVQTVERNIRLEDPLNARGI